MNVNINSVECSIGIRRWQIRNQEQLLNSDVINPEKEKYKFLPLSS
jgi:hypothetical protein